MLVESWLRCQRGRLFVSSLSGCLFRFTPEYGHVQRTSRCPLSANSGLVRYNNWDRYSITSSALSNSDRGMVSTRQLFWEE